MLRAIGLVAGTDEASAEFGVGAEGCGSEVTGGSQVHFGQQNRRAMLLDLRHKREGEWNKKRRSIRSTTMGRKKQEKNENKPFNFFDLGTIVSVHL